MNAFELGITLVGHRDVVTCVTFSPSRENLVATGSKDAGIRVFDVLTGDCLQTLDLREGVNALSWKDDGRVLAVALQGGNVVLLDAESTSGGAAGLEVALTLDAHVGDVTCVSWQPHGSLLASGGEDQRVVLWDRLGVQRGSLPVNHMVFVNAVAWSEDGSRLAVGRGGGMVEVFLVDSETVVLETTAASPVRALSWEGGLLVAGCENGTVRLWEEGEEGATGTLEGHGDIWCLSRQGNFVAVAGAESKDGCLGTATVRIWDLERREMVRSLPGRGICRAVAWKGQRLVAADDVGGLQVWEPGALQGLWQRRYALLDGEAGVIWARCTSLLLDALVCGLTVAAGLDLMGRGKTRHVHDAGNLMIFVVVLASIVRFVVGVVLLWNRPRGSNCSLARLPWIFVSAVGLDAASLCVEPANARLELRCAEAAWVSLVMQDIPLAALQVWAMLSHETHGIRSVLTAASVFTALATFLHMGRAPLVSTLRCRIRTSRDGVVRLRHGTARARREDVEHSDMSSLGNSDDDDNDSTRSRELSAEFSNVVDSLALPISRPPTIRTRDPLLLPQTCGLQWLCRPRTDLLYLVGSVSSRLALHMAMIYAGLILVEATVPDVTIAPQHQHHPTGRRSIDTGATVLATTLLHFLVRSSLLMTALSTAPISAKWASAVAKRSIVAGPVLSIAILGGLPAATFLFRQTPPLVSARRLRVVEISWTLLLSIILSVVLGVEFHRSEYRFERDLWISLPVVFLGLAVIIAVVNAYVEVSEILRGSNSILQSLNRLFTLNRIHPHPNNNTQPHLATVRESSIALTQANEPLLHA